MQPSSDARQIRLFCFEHGRPTTDYAGATILCDSDGKEGHVLAHDFPNAEFWEYCCDCECFYALEQAQKKREGNGQHDDSCLVCGRDLIRHYVCAECNVISHKSRERERRLFSITAMGLARPSCPGCLTATAAAVWEHECRILSINFTTAHSFCPFCKEAITHETHVAGLQATSARGAALVEVETVAATHVESEQAGESSAVGEGEAEGRSAAGEPESDALRPLGTLKRLGLWVVIIYHKRKAITGIALGLIAVVSLLLTTPVYEILIRPFNDPPVLKMIRVTPPKISSGGSVNMTAIAEDRDGDKLDYEWKSSTGNIVGGGESVTLVFTEGDGKVGDAPIKVWLRVMDKDGGDARDTVEVGIIPPPQNNAPRLTDLRAEKQRVVVGERVQLTAVAEDPDREDLSYQWASTVGMIENNGNRVAFLNTEGVSVTSGDIQVKVIVTVRDARGLSVSNDLIVAVQPSQRAESPVPTPTAPSNKSPYFLVPPPETAEMTAGDSLELEAYAMDPEGEKLTYSWSAQRGTIEGEGPSVTLNTSGLDGKRSRQNSLVTLTVRDPKGASTSGIIRLRVLPAEPVKAEPVPTTRPEPTPTAAPPAALSGEEAAPSSLLDLRR